MTDPQPITPEERRALIARAQAALDRAKQSAVAITLMLPDGEMIRLQHRSVPRSRSAARDA